MPRTIPRESAQYLFQLETLSSNNVIQIVVNSHQRISISYQFPEKPLECQEAFGLENGTVSDRQIITSSQLDGDQATSKSRLHFESTANKTRAWVAATTNAEQWLQVNLGTEYTVARVTRVATWGRSGAYRQWVTKYKLQYSHDRGENFQYYREQGQVTDKVK